MFFGDGSDAAKQAVEHIVPRSLDNFNWTFIFILAVVFYVYWSEAYHKNYKAIIAGFSLYGVHWFYEIMNAIIGKVSGYPLWSVSNESSSFVLLVGVSWELSMMFTLAGIISFKMMGEDRNRKILKFGKFKGISIKLFTTISMALLFSAVEIFLAATPAFIWVYKWWGAIPVFITTYIPFFLAANYVPDAKPKFQKIFLGSIWAVDALLLIILIPLGII
jgi:hypothetical protein